MVDTHLQDLIDLYIGKENVKSIVEAGACDGEDTLLLADFYPNATINTFEPNPEMIPVLKSKFHNPRIIFHELALTAANGTIIFRPIDTQKTITPHVNGNPGASSIFLASQEYPAEKYVQKMVKVETARFDSLDIKPPDVLWLDAQGAELYILKGMGELLKDVKIIKCEVLFKEQYLGAPLADEVIEYIESKGFRHVGYSTRYEWFGDALFINEKL